MGVTFVLQPSPDCAEIKLENASERQEVEDVRMEPRERSSWLEECLDLIWEPSPVLGGSPGWRWHGWIPKEIHPPERTSSSLNPVLALKDKEDGLEVLCCPAVATLLQALHSPLFENREIGVSDTEGDNREGRQTDLRIHLPFFRGKNCKGCFLLSDSMLLYVSVSII